MVNGFTSHQCVPGSNLGHRSFNFLLILLQSFIISVLQHINHSILFPVLQECGICQCYDFKFFPCCNYFK